MTTVGGMMRLGRDALAVKQARAVIGGALITVGLVVAGIGLPILFDFPLRWWWLGLVLVAMWTAAAWWWASIDHSRWAWRLTDLLLEVRWGVMVRRVQLVPRNRIQNVTTIAGPLQSRYGVVTLTVHTAGLRTPNVSIRDIDAGHAESIRRRLGLA